MKAIQIEKLLTGVDPTYMLSVFDQIEKKEWEINELIEEIDCK